MNYESGTNQLEKTRIRWKRWLGQKCRQDKPYWTTLLNTNWFNWASSILYENNHPLSPIRPDTREGIKEYFYIAIELSDISDFLRLDNLYCTNKLGL